VTLLFPGREKHKQRHRGSRTQDGSRPPRLPWLRNLRLAVAAHPRRAAVLGVLGLLLIGFIATSSLPMALAESYPRLALMLYPDHPQALMTLARDQQRALAAALPAPPAQAAAPSGAEAAAPADATVETPEDAATETPGPAAGTGEPAVAEALAPPPAASSEELAARRATIRDLATRTIAQAPLAADAYRLLGDTSGDLDATRQAMTEAVARSRRETVAAFWLLHQAYERGDPEGVVRMANVLLRTRPELNRYTLSYLNSLVLTPEGRDALAAALIAQPSWRPVFLGNLGQPLATSDAPLTLFQQLKAAGSPPTEEELVPFLRARMAADKSAGAAYNIWLQLLSADELAKVRPVNNIDFAAAPSTLPFNWSVPRSKNAFVDFPPRGEANSGRTLRVRFGIGRVAFNGVTQVTFLAPGTYRFTGMQKGSMSAKRGMRWQVQCYSSSVMAGQSDQLMGTARGWQEFSFDVTIPDDGGCDAQRLRLIHDARSTSEQFASGEIMFESLRIGPVPSAAAATPG
jgi:hypothetical protein